MKLHRTTCHLPVLVEEIFDRMQIKYLDMGMILARIKKLEYMRSIIPIP